MGMTDVVVRRRAGLTAVVTVLSGLVGLGYAVFAAGPGGSASWLLAALMAVICGVHAAAWRASRHPLMVGDVVGVRVRLGGSWTGLPWESIEQVEVEERRRVGDGRVTVVPRPGALDGLAPTWPGRLAIALNRRVFDAPLVVPFGLSTTVSVVDVAGSLERLSGGLTTVVRAADPMPAAAPTVELTAPRESLDPEPSPVSDLDAAAEGQPPAEPVVVDRPRNPVAPRLRGLLSAARHSTPADRVVSVPLARPAARRDEVVRAVNAPQPLTDGGLALSQPVEEPDAAALPEIEQLRRPSMDTGRAAAGAEGNVSLIIDATTDLSARAMQRVRRLHEPEPVTEPDLPTDDDEPAITLIGGQLAAARKTLGFTVDEVAARTRIRPYVIEHVEVDDFSPCGGDFYARGHLRTLARVLGLDARQLVEAYDEYFAVAPVNAREVFEAELATGRGGFVSGARGHNWVALAAVVLALGLVWGLVGYFTDGVDDTPATTTQTNAGGLGSPGPGNPPVVAPRTAHVKVAVAGGDARVVVRDRFRQVVFSGTIPDGAARKFTGEAPLRVKADDGSLVTLSTKGRDLGVLGQPGEPARTRVAASR